MASWGFRITRSRQNIATLLLAGIVSSELMWIIRVRHATDDLERTAGTQLALTRRVVERLRQGEKVDVKRELLVGNDDEQINAVMDELGVASIDDNQLASAHMVSGSDITPPGGVVKSGLKQFPSNPQTPPSKFL